MTVIGRCAGIPGPTGRSMTFTSAAAVLSYLPASGIAGTLDSDLLDPTSTASGAFGGYVLALRLDIAFDDSGELGGTSGSAFGDLHLCGLTSMPNYDAMTVRDYFVEVNGIVGGAPFSYLIDDIAILTNDVSLSFKSGVVSQFAQLHLFATACP